MANRKLKDWVTGLLELVEDTEAPRAFWIWGALYTIGATLRRQVWLPFGINNIYPNLYVLLVAPPAKARKGGPPKLAKQMLNALHIPVAVDSTSKRALTKELEEVSGTQYFTYKGKQQTQASLAVISSEMSSLLAIDPKGIIEFLTDVYDSHDEWKYKTSSQGSDMLYNLCVGAFIATTPTWLMGNLPLEAIGGGFTSRFAIITGYEKYKRLSIPGILDQKLYGALIHDLNLMCSIVGPFEWEEHALYRYDKWYNGFDAKIAATKDTRMHGYIERMHVIMLKVAMILRASYSDKLVLVERDVGRAIELVEAVLDTASDSLGGKGESKFGAISDMVMLQIKQYKRIPFHELLAINHRDANKTELEEIIETLVSMKVATETVTQDGTRWLKWSGP